MLMRTTLAVRHYPYSQHCLRDILHWITLQYFGSVKACQESLESEQHTKYFRAPSTYVYTLKRQMDVTMLQLHHSGSGAIEALASIFFYR